MLDAQYTVHVPEHAVKSITVFKMIDQAYPLQPQVIAWLPLPFPMGKAQGIVLSTIHSKGLKV